MKVLENKEVKLLYDFNIYTDKKITHRRPDIVIYNKKERKTTLVDVACPMDHNVERKEKEKIRNYEELQFKIEQL